MSLVLTEFDQSGVASIVLNRADKLNALSHQLMDAFLPALESVRERAEALAVRALLIRSSTPKAFCAGADLSERLKMDEEQVSATLAKQRSIVDGVAALPVPTLAVMEGLAFGFGVELAIACDLRVAHPACQMGLTETRLGIIPGAGGTQRLVPLVGRARAKEMIYLGKKLSGEEAERWGLVNALSERPLELARSWAQTITEGAPLALIAAKRAIEGEDRILQGERGMDWERKCYEQVLRSEDRVEGLRAFAEKRKPQYKGQ